MKRFAILFTTLAVLSSVALTACENQTETQETTPQTQENTTTPDAVPASDTAEPAPATETAPTPTEESTDSSDSSAVPLKNFSASNSVSSAVQLVSDSREEVAPSTSVTPAVDQDRNLVEVEEDNTMEEEINPNLEEGSSVEEGNFEEEVVEEEDPEIEGDSMNESEMMTEEDEGLSDETEPEAVSE